MPKLAFKIAHRSRYWSQKFGLWPRFSQNWDIPMPKIWHFWKVSARGRSTISH